MRKAHSGRAIKIGIVAVILVFLVVVGFFLLKEWETNRGRFQEQEIGDDMFEYNGIEYRLKTNLETFLIMGLDQFQDSVSSDSYNNDQQADFLMLFVFDNDTKQCTAIHINRDTMAKVNILGVAGNKVDTVTKQIALAHTYGNGKEVSCRNVADAASSLLLGMKINHYMSLTMDAVSVFNDSLGGVEVEVLDDFSEIDSALVRGENVTLMGEQALLYIRERKDLEDSSNLSRMARQRQYLQALYEKARSGMAGDEEFIVKTSLKLSDYTVSNCSLSQLQSLAKKMSEYNFLGFREIEGEALVGTKFMEFYPDEESVAKIVVDLFYEAKQ